MCHWVLRVWQCGDSFFTKCSSCSFDRAAHDPNHLLNPLHPSITPFGAEKTAVDTKRAPQVSKRPRETSRSGPRVGGSGMGVSRKKNGKSKSITSDGPIVARPAQTGSNGATTDCGHDETRDEGVLLLPLSEIGKASRFGDSRLGESSKCNVFEVVLQTREKTACPACMRSPRRARLPAHARGCFGLG